MIAIIDYGVGNLFSLKSSLNSLGIENIVTKDINEIEKADKIILPGVGAFKDAIDSLKNCGLDKVVLSQVEKGNRSLASALVCSFFLKKAMNTESTRALGL